MTKEKKIHQKPNKENRGVTANSDVIVEQKLLKDCDCFGKDPISLRNVRQDLENVIEMMGPNTPQFEQTISGDADNEDSLYSTSVISSVVKIRTVKKNEYENVLSYREDSQMTTGNLSELEREIIQTNEVAIQTTDMLHQPFLPFNTPQVISYPLIMMPPQCDQKLQTSQPRRSFLSRYLHFKNKNSAEKKSLELYKIQIQNENRDRSPPKRLVFDLVDNLPKNATKTTGTNTNNKKTQKQKMCHKPLPQKYVYTDQNENILYNSNIRTKNDKKEARMEIYYFDHGNSDYYRTTDAYPAIITETVAEKTEFYTAMFWAQIFGAFDIGISFVISFLLQFIRFILHGIIRPLIVGLIQLISDYFIKPFLAIIFNGLIQPVLIFLFNVATSVRDFVKPIAESIGYVIREIAELCRACRFIQINRKTYVESPRMKCNNNENEDK